MRIKRTVLAPLLISGMALASGGWLLQRGTAQEQSVYMQARLFEEVMQRVSSRFVDAKDPSQLYEMAINGMLEELGDPHSSFMSPEDYDKLRVQTEGEYGGLGIQIDERENWITVIAPLPGTPAERAGMMSGDKIIEVDGESTRGWTTDLAVSKLRGPVGKGVELKVARVGADAPLSFQITREEIHVKSVPSAYMMEGGVGYVELSVFAETSTQELVEAIEKLRGQGMKSLVLDLRYNPGGLLDQGVMIADLFLPEGKLITEMKGRTSDANQKFVARDEDHYPDLPLVVLVNPGSASASEIVAGALQDHDRALVVGQTTFGKGSVQTLFPLPGGNFLKLTTARWYTPSGRSIQKPYGIDQDRAVAHADSAAETADSLETFRTAMGRTVYGGGGIRPDLVLTPDTFTTAEREFARAVEKHGSKFRDVLYKYSVAYGRSNAGLARDVRVTPAMLEEFYGELKEAGVSVERELYAGASKWVSSQMAYQIALSKWGQQEARRIANREDSETRKAVELLRKATTPRSLFSLAGKLETQAAAAAPAGTR